MYVQISLIRDSNSKWKRSQLKVKKKKNSEQTKHNLFIWSNFVNQKSQIICGLLYNYTPSTRSETGKENNQNNFIVKQ